MAVQVRELIPSKEMEAAQTTQYTATNVSATIDKFTATNYSGSAAVISVHLVPVSGSAGNDNITVVTKTIQPGATYIFPELVGHSLERGSFISTTGTGSALSIRASGREFT